MSTFDLDEHEISLTGASLRKMIKKIQSDIRSMDKFHEKMVMPEIREAKENKILILRGVAEKLRFQLDI